MAITLKNGLDELGIKTVDKMGVDKMGSYQEEAYGPLDIIWKEVFLLGVLF